MLKRRRFIIGGLIILAALSYIIYGGMQEAIVYFVTPSELKAKGKPVPLTSFYAWAGWWLRDRCKKTSRISPIPST